MRLLSNFLQRHSPGVATHQSLASIILEKHFSGGLGTWWWGLRPYIEIRIQL